MAKWGFFSDVTSGPFYAFGTTSSNAQMLKKANEKHTVTSQQVSEYNIREYVDQIKQNAGDWKVKFLNCDVGVTIETKRSKHVGAYDVVYLSSGQAQWIGQCAGLLKDGGQVIVEGARYVVKV